MKTSERLQEAAELIRSEIAHQVKRLQDENGITVDSVWVDLVRPSTLVGLQGNGPVHTNVRLATITESTGTKKRPA